MVRVKLGLGYGLSVTHTSVPVLFDQRRSCCEDLGIAKCDLQAAVKVVVVTVWWW